MITRSGLSLLALLFAALLSPRAALAIAGGWFYDYDKAAFMVQVEDHCAGTLISDQWVLTAAHCVKKYRIQRIYGGGPSRLWFPEAYEVSKVFESPLHQHPDYDIALIKLYEPINLQKSKMKPIRLADPAFEAAFMKPPMLARIYGWGDTGDRKQDWGGTNELHSAVAPIQPNEIANAKESYRDFIKDPMFAVGFKAGGVGACSGDSGGPITILDPVTHEPVQMGVMSWAFKCDAPNYYSVYNKVSMVYDWIKKTMEEESRPKPSSTPKPVRKILEDDYAKD